MSATLLKLNETFYKKNYKKMNKKKSFHTFFGVKLGVLTTLDRVVSPPLSPPKASSSSSRRRIFL